MSVTINKEALAKKFMSYVRIDTQSDPDSKTAPTTAKQKNLSKQIFDELQQLGLSNIYKDDYGYVYATIEANTTKKNVPVICFCSHVDTTPDVSGADVKPILHVHYNGEAITLPDDTSQVLDTNNSPYLKEKIGDDIFTASGTTLLGADDKAGLAIIMQMAETLMNDSSIPHGEIRIVFTPDEEVGRGVDYINMDQVNADFGYTLDGSELGNLAGESFSADGATIVIEGVSTHPCCAKNIMVNAAKIAGEVLAVLPKDSWSPETTEGTEGFVHPVSVTGMVEQATIQFIVRSFNTADLETYHIRLENIVKSVLANHPKASYTYTKTEQYRNMKEVIETKPLIIQLAKDAMKNLGIEVKEESIRGGTDGSRLSFMGLPCPNLFTGMQNIHSKLEWVSLQDMVKATQTIIEIVTLNEQKASTN